MAVYDGRSIPEGSEGKHDLSPTLPSTLLSIRSLVHTPSFSPEPAVWSMDTDLRIGGTLPQALEGQKCRVKFECATESVALFLIDNTLYTSLMG